MKRTIITTAIFALLLLCGGMARGQNDLYPYIRIADVQVTQNNQDSITSSYISGTIRYNPDSRTLTFDNATVLPYHYQSPNWWEEEYHEVTIGGRHSVFNIELIGDNVISGLSPLVLLEGTFNIKGPGTLTLNSTYFQGVFCDIDVPTFTISQGAHVNINIAASGVVTPAFDGSTGLCDPTFFEVDSSFLTINAPRCFSDIGGFQLHGCYVSWPQGTYYDPNCLSLVTESGIVGDHLEILPGTVNVHDYLAERRFAWGTTGGIYLTTESCETRTVEVINMMGKTVYAEIPKATKTFIPMSAGVYIVRVGNRSMKVMVK